MARRARKEKMMNTGCCHGKQKALASLPLPSGRRGKGRCHLHNCLYQKNVFNPCVPVPSVASKSKAKKIPRNLRGIPISILFLRFCHYFNFKLSFVAVTKVNFHFVCTDFFHVFRQVDFAAVNLITFLFVDCT